MTRGIESEEYRQRVMKLQQAMSAHGLDALLVYGWKRNHVRYLTGYYPNYIANVAMVAVPRAGDPAMRIRFPFDLERARRESWLVDVAASGELMKLVEDSAAVLRGLGLAEGRIGLVTGDRTIDEMPFSVHQRLQGVLPSATFDQCSDLLLEARITKSPAEFAMLRESALIADAGALAAEALMEPGRSEFEVIAAAEAQARKLGAGAYLAVIGSRGSEELIGPPEERALEDGDNVILEIAVEKAGYWAQVARVFHVGAPTDEQREIDAATYQAYQVAVDACQPGTSCADVAAKVQAILEMRGLAKYLEVDLGHGIGMDLPEPPRVEPGDSTLIQPGMVLVVHPSVRVPGVGGAFLGGTVLIEQSGPEPIHEIPSEPGMGGHRR